MLEIEKKLENFIAQVDRASVVEKTVSKHQADSDYIAKIVNIYMAEAIQGLKLIGPSLKKNTKFLKLAVVSGSLQYS